MISLLEAQRAVDRFRQAVSGSELVPCDQAVGRVLAEEPESDRDLPPFDRVTMDGYAVRSADLPGAGRLRLVGEVAAGGLATRTLEKGEAYRIMTGAPLPPGADAVVRVEDTREDGPWVELHRGARPGQNVHPRGEDLRRGDRPLGKHARVTVATLPLLLTLGRSSVRVLRRPEVAILTSGNELVDASQVPGEGQIRDSNRAMLAALVRSAGGEPHCLPIVRDDPEALQVAVADGMRSDLLLLTGGSSVGRYDYSKEVVAATGAECHFQKVAIKPGKPVLYFTTRTAQVFCLPGNPVSAFVTFELLVRPALERRLGLLEVWPVPLRLATARGMSAPPERDLYQVARTIEGAERGGWAVEPVRWHGSGDVVSIASTNALIHVPRGRSVEAGDEVPLLPLRRCEEDAPRRAEPVA